MSSFDKTVKLACKPKAAAPKSKYIDPIIAATWSDDGAVHDVCKALVTRIREPNTIVVFKALIVLHTMMRAGSTDNVLSYLSSSNILRLRNISAANWEGYTAPQNLQNYALYLESRIMAYKELKHDAIKVQFDSNRDMRNSLSNEEGSHRGRKERKVELPTPTRSKTITGRKLRSMTVEKGLLRETKVVHRMIDALVECRFYLDDLQDELTITALQMLVKDLLILFQAGNEGVINVLECYFEMSHVDAEAALKLYRRFCKQTEQVVEFLGVAKKLQNLLNVSIPNLKHAPVSLAGALQEYLDDPNFEQNRIEYKMNKEATKANGTKVTKGSSSQSSSATKSPSPSNPVLDGKAESPPTSTPRPRDGKNKEKEVHDFFSAIEEEDPTLVNPPANSPNAAPFQQQTAPNPFTQMFGFQQPQFQVAVQPTGFLVPQATAVPNPFNNSLTPQVSQPTGHSPFSTFVPQQLNGMFQQPQPTGALATQPFLQPQTTGANPFRQSALIPQTTGMQLFGVGNAPPMPALPQSQSMMNLGLVSGELSPAPGLAAPFSAPTPSFGPVAPRINNVHVPARPSSTPLTSSTRAASSTLQGVKTHQTGTRNPFGPVSPPPVPKPPTLFELSTGLLNQNQNQQQVNQTGSQLQQAQVQQQPPQPFDQNGFNFGQSSLSPGAVDISSVASSFAFGNSKSSNPSFTTRSVTSDKTHVTKTAASSTTSSGPLFSLTPPPQPTGMTGSSFLSSAPSATSPVTNSTSSTPVTSHVTGFTGLKPFKPTSSFGASLFESLPPIAGSSPTTPPATGLPSTGTSNFSSLSTVPSNMVTGNTAIPRGISELSSTTITTTQSSLPSSNFSFLNSQPTGAAGAFGTGLFGSTVGVGLRPQLAGGGPANPFRASMATGSGNNSMHLMPPLPTGLEGMQAFGGGVGGGQMGTQNQQPASLI